MQRREFACALVTLTLPRAGAAQPPAASRSGWINVRASGAAGDGARLDTAAIQSAVDACAQHGGGTVWFPPGTYLSGTIVLRDRVRLETGATLLGSTGLADYPTHIPKLRSYTDSYTEKRLIYAEGILGPGLEGDGAAVRTSDCHIVSGDDAIVLKSTAMRPCRDVVVSNCVTGFAVTQLKI